MSIAVKQAWAILDARAEVNAKELIEKGEPAVCFICAQVGREKVETLRYCASCFRGFCTAKHHGNFAHNRGVCLYCGIPKEDRSKVRGLVKYRKKAAEILLGAGQADDFISSALSVTPESVKLLRDSF